MSACREGLVWYTEVLTSSKSPVDIDLGSSVNRTYNSPGLQISEHLPHFEEPMDLLYHYT